MAEQPLHQPGPALRGLRETGWRLIASSPLPPAVIVRGLPPCPELRAAKPPLTIEIVSHCWRYSHLLTYQLSSLVNHPPRHHRIRMTVCYCPEDPDTAALLDWFGGQCVPGVAWHWLPMPRKELMRRSIGRNRVALSTRADWVWFTDCDLFFGEGALDALGDALTGRSDPLVFPREERVSPILGDDAALLTRTRGDAAQALWPVDTGAFDPLCHDKAIGPLQIMHGDLARTYGYCDAIGFYQRPVTHWQKTFEDRTFRWLIGTQGTAIDVPGIFRIRHASKGRYHQSGLARKIRMAIRRFQHRYIRQERTPDNSQ
ncbi:MAG: glycosyltransferase family 2 protein [Opitutales bacterium]